MADLGGGGPNPSTPTVLRAPAACWPHCGAGPSAIPSSEERQGQAPVFNPAAVGDPDRALAAALDHSSSAFCAGGAHGAHGRPIPEARAAGGSNAPEGAPICGAAAARPPAALASGPNRSPEGAQSFAQVLLRSLQPVTAPFPVHPPAHTDAGEPAVFFTQEEISWSCQPLQTAVIARTPQGRPPFQEIRNHLLQRFKLQRDFVISSLDKRHLLIRFQDNEDFLQVLLKESMLVQGRLFKFFRWSVDFCPDMDSPVVPLWLELPQLPANFFNEAMIRSIAGSLGQVLKIDRNTLTLASTQAARVNVQLDVSKTLPERLWVGCGSKGFWQPIIYPGPPSFCSGCRRLGHLLATCKKIAPSSAQGHSGVAPEQSASTAARTNANGLRPMDNKKWRPVLPTDVPPTSMGHQQTPLAAEDDAHGTAHNLFDKMPPQPLPPQMGQGPVPGAQAGTPHMSSTAHHSNEEQGMLPHTAYDIMHASHAPLPPPGRQQRPAAVDAAAPETAHHLLDALPQSHPPMGSATSDQGDGPNLPLIRAITVSCQDAPSPIAQGQARTGHLQQSTAAPAPMAAAPTLLGQPPKADTATVITAQGALELTASSPYLVEGGQTGASTISMPPSSCLSVAPQVLGVMPRPGIQDAVAAPIEHPMAALAIVSPSDSLQTQSSSVMYAQQSTATAGAQVGCSPLSPSPVDRMQVFDEMPHSGAPVSKAVTAAPMVASPPPVNPLNIHAAKEMQSIITPAHVVHIATAQQLGAPIKTRDAPNFGKQKGILLPAPSLDSSPSQPAVNPDLQTPIMTAKADRLLDDPNSFARFLAGPPAEATPASCEQKCTAPPSSPARLSFAEALRKKTKKGEINMMAYQPTPPPFTFEKALREEAFQPPPQAPGRPRTRSTTVLTMDSDGEYEDFSE